MNIREVLYFTYHRLAGTSLGQQYKSLVKEDQSGVPQNTTKQLLIKLLIHAEHSVPYYSKLIREMKSDFKQEPESYLLHFPILTKELIRENFDQLKSLDLGKRKWFLNTSGGSTGEPIKLIQDQEHWDRSIAIQMLGQKWAGREFGEPGVWVWGSERDILQGTTGLKMVIANKLANNTYLNAFHMNAENMRECINVLNSKPPKLIIAYAQAMYELALFVEREALTVTPQSAIMTCAGTLYPFMREKIEAAFQCEVFNQYGSREVGNIACECKFHSGLHVFPWGSYVEIVDDEGNPVPKGVEGNIIVTSLTNFAMPLIRYSIGDRGVLLPEEKTCLCGRIGPTLEKILGRSVDMFKTKEGALVDGEYFTHLLYFRDWVHKFQVLQKSRSLIVFKIIKNKLDHTPSELDEIVTKTKIVMGDDCQVVFEFVDDLPPSASGKYRYTMSEVQN